MIKEIIIGVRCLLKKPVTYNLKQIKEQEYTDLLTVNNSKCINCKTCERICPNKCIKLTTKAFNFTTCCYCKLCVAYCPKKALTNIKNITKKT